MAITSLDGYTAAPKQNIPWFKTAARTTVAAIPFSLFDIAGVPGPGTLAIGNTANGIVPDDSVAGYPNIAAAGIAWWLGTIEYGSSVACRLHLYDCLFSAGAYAFNANVTLASQPSYAGRVPGGDYRGLELWLEAVTAFTGNPSVQLNYLDDGGAAGDTGVIGTGAALTVGRMFKMPLAAGDMGVQRLDQVRGTVATVGTFNVHVMRRLWSGRVRIVNDGDRHSFVRTGLKRVFDSSALRVIVQPDSTASGLPEVYVELVDG